MHTYANTHTHTHTHSPRPSARSLFVSNQPHPPPPYLSPATATATQPALLLQIVCQFVVCFSCTAFEQLIPGLYMMRQALVRTLLDYNTTLVHTERKSKLHPPTRVPLLPFAVVVIQLTSIMADMLLFIASPSIPPHLSL